MQIDSTPYQRLKETVGRNVGVRGNFGTSSEKKKKKEIMRMPCDNGDRDWIDESTSQET